MKNSTDKLYEQTTDTLAERIKIARYNAERMSQAKLAEALGYGGNNPSSTVSNWEKTEKPSPPPIEAIAKMCDLFDCDADYFIRPSVQTTKKKRVGEISDYIGLSPDSVDYLNQVNTAAQAHIARIIDTLILYHRYIHLVPGHEEECREYNLFDQLHDYFYPSVKAQNKEEEKIYFSLIGRQIPEDQPSWIRRPYNSDQLKRQGILETLSRIKKIGIVSRLKGIPGRTTPDKKHHES